MRFYNFLTRATYTVTAVWMGFFVYLFMASIIYLAAVIVSDNPLIIVGDLLLLAAAGATVYGFFHAKNVSVKTIEVTLPSLPQKWQGRKAVWISDTHIGQVHGKKDMAKTVRMINSLAPDIAFIGGDLFDGSSVPAILELVTPLAEIRSPLGIYFVLGNHEQFENSEPFINKLSSLGITILKNRMIEINGLQLVGIEYSRATKKEGLRTALAGMAIDKSKPSILLKHEPSDLDIAEEAGISLQISGHTHKAQQWPLNYISEWTYKGYSYGLNPHGTMQVFTSSGTGTWGPPIRVGSDCEIIEFIFK
jgi:predicted MPP superfamily phosphohydrolase